MSFRGKLTVFLVATLFGLQAAIGFATYMRIRGTLIGEGIAQLTTATGQFTRQLDELEGQLATGVNILTLDFPLREAIAQRDEATVVSALRNHGRRIGASRMLLVETDGTIGADTSVAVEAPGTRFDYAGLLERAADEGRVATVAVVGGHAEWLVIVAVLAPDPIAYVAAELPLNDELLARLSSLSGVPRTTGLAVAGPDGVWRASAGPIEALVQHLPADGAALQELPSIIGTPAGEIIFLVRPLATPPGSAAVAAVMGYPLTDALRPYRGLVLVLLIGMAIGLPVAIVGGWLIARGVARPIEELARYTRRIGEGDYTPPVATGQRDEIGQLGTALGNMARAIADREAQIRHQASHEPVTGLPNRQAMVRAIDAGLLQAPAAVVVVSVVRLEEIANTVGREIADRIMRDAAERLGEPLGAVPLGCVGERSFAALLTGWEAGEALAMGALVVAAFEQPYRDGDLTIDASVAVGIALAPQHGHDAEQLLRHAEVALLAALGTGTRCAAYCAEADPHRPELLSLMSDLRRGLLRGELQLYYQPKLNLHTHTITGAEALVRWRHPTRGDIPPEIFITLAEETGNIQYLTRWVLDAGLAEAARWRSRGLELSISINLSVRDLADAELPRRIAGLLERFDLPPETLVLEVTESAIMREPDIAIAVLRQLDAQGIALSIDDFGVGQSSLAYLRRLPVRELKIDKAFVLRLAQSADDQTIARSVIELGHNLDYRVTAEGVEDEAGLRLLEAYGCDYAQGYFIARALPADAFFEMAAQSQRQHRFAGALP